MDEETKLIIYDTTALNLTTEQVNSFSLSDIATAKIVERKNMIMSIKHDKDMKILLLHDWKIESSCKTRDGFVFEDEIIDNE